MPLIPFTDLMELFAPVRSNNHAECADSYVLVEIERRMWPSSLEDITRTNGDEGVATCAICLDLMNADSCVTLPCKHCLHIKCAQMSERYAILDQGTYQCPECRENVSSVQANYFSNGGQVWRIKFGNSSTTFAQPEVEVGVHEDGNLQSAPAAGVHGQIGTVTQQQLQQQFEPSHSSLAPHPFAPFPRPPEDAQLEPHDVHMSGTTAPLAARAILDTETAGQRPNGTIVDNTILAAAILLPQSFPSDQEARRAGLRTGGGWKDGVSVAIRHAQVEYGCSLIEDMLNVSHDAYALGQDSDKASAPPLAHPPPPATSPSSASADVPMGAPCVTPPPIPMALGQGSHTTPNQLSRLHTRNLLEGSSSSSSSSARTPVTLQRSITKAELEATHLQVAVYQEQVARRSRRRYICGGITLFILLALIMATFIIWRRFSGACCNAAPAATGAQTANSSTAAGTLDPSIIG